MPRGSKVRRPRQGHATKWTIVVIVGERWWLFQVRWRVAGRTSLVIGARLDARDWGRGHGGVFSDRVCARMSATTWCQVASPNIHVSLDGQRKVVIVHRKST